MADREKPGIYFIVDFDWPQPLQEEHGRNARNLHDMVQDRSWIREVAAASGGIGVGRSSTWIFWLEGYAALERLLRDEADEVGRAYRAFFGDMARVEDKVREEVVFL